MRKLELSLGLVLVVVVLWLGALFLGWSVAEAAATPTSNPVIDRVIERGELRVGTAGDMPPFNMTTKQGELVGFDIDLSRYIASVIGVKVKFVTMPFAELLPALENGRVDIVLSSMTITPKRNLRAAFVGPYFVTGKSFLSKRQTMANLEDLSSLNKPDVKIAALKNSTSQALLQNIVPKAKVVPTSDYKKAVELVVQDKADALFADWSICKVSTLRYPDKGLISMITPITYEPLGIALPPNDALFLNLLQNVLNEFKDSGVLEDLEAHWLEDYSWIQELPEEQVKK